MRHIFILLLPCFIACDEGSELTPNTDSDVDETHTGDTADTDIAPPCETTVTSVSPEDGATNTPVDTTIEVVFSEAVVDGSWSVEVQGISGSTILDDTQTIVSFEPSTALDYETEYTILASACGINGSSSFTTVAEPLDMTILDGRTYELPYADLVWVKPSAISLISSYIDFDAFLVQVDSIDIATQTLNVISAVGYDVSGTMTPDCNSLFEPGVGDFSQNPIFSAGPSDMILPVGTDEVTIEGFAIRATFNSDGSSLEDIEFVGSVDTRPLDATLGNTCNLAGFLGDTCVPCNDGAVKCLEMYATAQAADWNSAIDLVTECP